MPPSIVNLLELSTPSARNSPVQAYAKLEFGAYSFYVQSLSVTLGRKASDSDPVDIHLGTSKSISRTHARLQYSFARHCFEICVVGRNGLFVDDVFYDQGNVVPLEDRYFHQQIQNDPNVKSTNTNRRDKVQFLITATSAGGRRRRIGSGRSRYFRSEFTAFID